MMKEVKKRSNKREEYRQLWTAAMPEVRELVKKHGISIVSSCITRLREYEKKQYQARKLREEADKLEQELQGDGKQLKIRSA